MLVRKRNGIEVEFDKTKIRNAITRANNSVAENKLTDKQISGMVTKITKTLELIPTVPTVEDIQNLVERELIYKRNADVAKAFITYRYMHSINRPNGNIAFMDQVRSMLNGVNQDVIDDNANKSPIHHNVSRDYMAGFVCKEYAKELIPTDIMEAHREGIIHYHDMDYAPAMAEHNCDLLDIYDMLWNGTEMGGVHIHRPHSLTTAGTVTTQISMNAASSQYGGQTISLSHLAPFVDISRQNHILEVTDELYGIEGVTKEKIEEIAERRVKKDIASVVQTIQYQEITCACSNGQSPFITVFMYLDEVPAGRLRDDLAMLIEETLKQRITGIQAPDGEWVAPVFPKLIYVLDEDNIEKGTRYYYLTELARDCTAKRMCPDYVSAKVMKKLRGEVFSSMGCRSQLSVLYPAKKPEVILEYGTKENGHEGLVRTVDNKWRDPNKAVFYGRFNMGVITLNLPDIALSVLKQMYKAFPDDVGKKNYSASKSFMAKFWKLFDERLELCHRALRTRYERLKGTNSNVAPILWNAGALARLKEGETIDRLLINGWATISLGYAGLYECVKSITGQSHTSELGRDIGMQIMKRMHDACIRWKETEPEHLGYSLYGTPIERTTDKFAKSLQRRFGIIDGITDKQYVTNSYHIPVFEKIDAFSKLSVEAPFQDLSSGGNISYIELPSMYKNPDALMAVIKHIYENNIYAEINTKLDHCYCCGFSGEITLIKTDKGKFKLHCPNCGNEDARKMYVIRRLCGYIGRIDSKDNPVNPNPSSSEGRLGDIADRVCHL